MKIRMVVSQFGLTKSVPQGAVLNVRRMGDGYQVITGEFAGRHIEPGKCIELTQEAGISVAEWNEVEQGYLKIINKLEEQNKHIMEKCEEIADKYGELLSTHKFFIETVGKALTRIDELKQQKEPIKNG